MFKTSAQIYLFVFDKGQELNVVNINKYFLSVVYCQFNVWALCTTWFNYNYASKVVLKWKLPKGAFSGP